MSALVPEGELQDAVRQVFASRGEWAGDAVIIVEVVGDNGKPSLVTVAGELPRWSILGRLEWARAQVVQSMAEG